MRGSTGTLAGALAVLGVAHGFETATLLVIQDQTRRTLHCPMSMSRSEGVLSTAELAELHHRVIGERPHAFEQPLPSPDLFDRPKGGMIVVLDGMMQGPELGVHQTPFLGGERTSDYTAHVDRLTGMQSVAAAYNRPTMTGMDSRVVCVSGKQGEGLCGQSAIKLNPLVAPLDMEVLHSFHSDVKHFDHDREADRAFLSELQSMLNLHSQTPPTSAAPGSPADTYLFFSDSLQKLGQRYGEYSREVALARRLMDRALDVAMGEMSKAYDGAFVTQVVLGDSPSPATRRRLAEEDSNITASDIEKVNVITWTAVGLAAILFLALSLVFSADSGPKDSLLYAKFQADVSGGKMD